MIFRVVIYHQGDKIFLILFLPKVGNLQWKTRQTNQQKRKVILFFRYWFGFARMKKSHFLTLIPGSLRIALRPVTLLEVSLYGLSGGTSRYSLGFPVVCCERSREPATAENYSSQARFIPFSSVVTLLCLLDWADIFSQEFWASLKLKINWLHQVQLKCKCWHLIYEWLENAFF